MSDLLLKQHRDDLRRSGLSDDQIKACGFYSISTERKIGEILGWKNYRGGLGACLAIPFRKSDGSLNGFCRLKPDRPRKDKKKPGRAVKYEGPKGKPNRAYFPPATVASLEDPTATLCITEGEKKAAKADQEGFACIGLTGVNAGHKRRESKDEPFELIDDLDQIEWQGRSVAIIFDSDAAGNSNILWAEFNLAQTLKRRGAEVRAVRLPDGGTDENGEAIKVGLDDFLISHTADDLKQLIDNATEPAQPISLEDIPLLETADDPHKLARLFLKERPTLKCWRDELYEHDGAAYQIIPPEEIKASITEVAKREFDRCYRIAMRDWDGHGRKPSLTKVSRIVIGNTLQALRSLSFLPNAVESPSWLTEERFPAAECISTQSAIVHLPNLVANRSSAAIQPTPDFFTLNAMACDFDINARCPHWLDFLQSAWPDDRDAIATLQEIFGYLLLPDTSQQKMFLLIGPKRSGKGTIGRLVRELVGKQNTAAPTLGSLQSEFGLQPLIGKTVAIVGDARLSARSDLATITERLLSITGEDAQTINRKHLSQITTQLPIRFVISTNELPRLDDASATLPSRFITIRFSQSFFGREDHQLFDRLRAELSGILLWAIAGWERLNARGYFVQPKSSERIIEEMEEISSPVTAFIRDRCRIEGGAQTPMSEVFQAYEAWCKEKGRRPTSQQMFGRDLRAACPMIGDSQPRIEGKQVRTYEGIKLADK